MGKEAIRYSVGHTNKVVNKLKRREILGENMSMRLMMDEARTKNLSKKFD
jgi:hypothetical protein